MQEIEGVKKHTPLVHQDRGSLSMQGNTMKACISSSSLAGAS